MLRDFRMDRIVALVVFLVFAGLASSCGQTGLDGDETPGSVAAAEPRHSDVTQAPAGIDTAQLEPAGREPRQVAQLSKTLEKAAAALGAPAARKEVYAALDAAIGRLKAKDYRGFLEHDFPIDSLRSIRKRDRVDEEVAAFAGDPEVSERILKLLEAARTTQPVFSQSNTLATFTIEPPKPKDAAAGSEKPAVPSVPDPVVTAARLQGYGNDLPRVIAQAIATLEKGDTTGFLQSVLPAGELRHPDAAARVAEADRQMQENHVLSQQMLDDLKAIQQLSPSYEEERSVAVYQLEGEKFKFSDLPAGGSFITLPTRVFKFQLVEGSWRFYDSTTQVRREVAAMSRLEPIETEAIFSRGASGNPVLVMEKFGNCWRIAEFPRTPRW